MTLSALSDTHHYESTARPGCRPTLQLKPSTFVRKLSFMEKPGTLFGWAFGDAARADEPGYLDELRREALENATQDAARRGFKVEAGEEAYAVLQAGETLVDVDSAPDRLVVRCTVKLSGPGSESVHAVGPMNG